MRKKFPSYEEAQKICAINGIRNSTEYDAKCSSLGLPADPHKVYVGRWINFNTFMHSDPINSANKGEIEKARDYLLANGPTNVATLCEALKFSDDESRALRKYVSSIKFPFSLNGRVLSLSLSRAKLLTLGEVRQIIKENGIESWARYRQIRFESELPLPSYQHFGMKWADLLGKRSRLYSRNLMTREECVQRLKVVWPKVQQAMPHLTLKSLVRSIQSKRVRKRLFSEDFLTSRFPKRFDWKYGSLTEEEVAIITGQKSSSDQLTGLPDGEI
nr:hypothetical protein BdHM001_36470 [Bdellovibrio sp. HM001]